jgi:ribonuclease HII
VLSRGFVELLGGILAELPNDEEPMLVACDKQGGRNFYAGMVQEAFPNGWVIAERESGVESRYRVELLDRRVTITFRPRADGDSVAVALASMLCKYLREICMRQFNRFWEKHAPGIESTAGYPVDAKRFYEAIQPAMEKLGLVEDQVWRKR